jgi:FAD/FMN-containing dehydrogenase
MNDHADATAERAPVPAAALDAIKQALGSKGWTDDPDIMAPYLMDMRELFPGRAALLARPAGTDEVAALVAICAEHGVAIVPQGGNTGLVGAGVPHAHGGEILVNMGRMNKVRAIDPLNDTITVDAGCVLADIQEAAADADRLFPLSLGAEGSCQIGGNLSTNAGGTGVLHYGNARALVLGLEVVLPDGRLWDGLRGLRKDNTGYDLKQLFIGAEGTLGIITGAVLRLFPKPRRIETALAAIPDPAASIELLARLRAALGDQVTAIELMPRIGFDMALRNVPGTVDPLRGRHDWYVLLEVSATQEGAALRDGLEAVLATALEDGLVEDAVIAETGAQRDQIWFMREAIPLSQKAEGGSIKHDISVPVSRVADFIAEADAACIAAMPGVRPVGFGHVGDGNMHYNLTEPEGADTEAFMAEWERMNRVVHAIVERMGGSISAEHGIGQLKRGELRRYRSKTELSLMHTLKSALDPQGIMNPGKVL